MGFFEDDTSFYTDSEDGKMGALIFGLFVIGTAVVALLFGIVSTIEWWCPTKRTEITSEDLYRLTDTTQAARNVYRMRFRS